MECCSFLFTYIFPQIVLFRHQYLLLYFRTRNFMNKKFYEQEITKCIIVQETITYLSPLHPSKNNTQTRSLYSFFCTAKK